MRLGLSVFGVVENDTREDILTLCLTGEFSYLTVLVIRLSSAGLTRKAERKPSSNRQIIFHSSVIKTHHFSRAALTLLKSFVPGSR